MAGEIPPEARPAPWLATGASHAEENDPGYDYHADELPLPGRALRVAVSGPDLAHFLYIGQAWAAFCMPYVADGADHLVLDLGCGAGKMARFFALNPRLRYVGFDIYRPAVDWCRSAFGARYGDRFTFEHFDGHSHMYNPGGTVRARDYRFPAADASVDLVIGASIFTHLTEEDAKHYLRETARCLRSGGFAVFSIHTLDELGEFFPGAALEPGARYVGNEQVTLVAPDYFAELAAAAGLRVHSLPGRLCGQEVMVFCR